MSDEHGFGVQVGIGTLGQVAMMLIGFGGSVVLARVLGPVEFGAFYALLAVVSVLRRPISGWAAGCRKRFREIEFPGREAMGATLLGVGLWTVVTGLGTWAVRGQIATYSGRPDGWLLLSALLFGLGGFSACVDVLRASRQFGTGNWLVAVRELARVVFQIGLVLGAGLGVLGMVGGMVLGNLVVVPIVLVLIGVPPAVPTRARLADIWTFARASIPRSVLSTGQDRIDVILLGVLAGSGVVGNYEVALKLTIPALLVTGTVVDGLLGRISDRRSRGQDVARDVQNTLGYASLFAIPLFAGALVIGEPVVVTIYSSQYASAGAFVAGLALFRVVRTQKKVLAAVVDGFDRPAWGLKVSVVVFLLNLILGVGLYLHIGAIGVVAATVISEFVAYAGLALLVRRLVPAAPVLPRALLDQVAAGVLMAVVIGGLRWLLGLPTWWAVFAYVGLGGVTYFGGLFALSRQFRSTMRGVAADAGVVDA
jgi:O-antigen/teichoic acid export membrane protein